MLGSLASPPADLSTLAVSVEPMKRRHLVAVGRIDTEVYPRPWSAALYLQELAQPPESRVYRVAKVGGAVVGYGGIMLVAGDAHVTSVAVHPRWHGAGIATRIMLALARGAVERAATAFTLEVRVGNDRAQALYRRFGFAPAGVRARYYQPEGEDALVMWAHDIDTPYYLDRLRTIEAELPGETTWSES